MYHISVEIREQVPLNVHVCQVAECSEGGGFTSYQSSTVLLLVWRLFVRRPWTPPCPPPPAQPTDARVHLCLTRHQHLTPLSGQHFCVLSSSCRVYIFFFFTFLYKAQQSSAGLSLSIYLSSAFYLNFWILLTLAYLYLFFFSFLVSVVSEVD